MTVVVIWLIVVRLISIIQYVPYCQVRCMETLLKMDGCEKQILIN